MKKNHYSIAICILVILTACTSHRLQNFSDNDIPLDQLVNHLPANDSVESTLIFNAILDYGLEGVVHICRQLGFHDDQDLVQAKWALHGLAVYVTGRGREQKRELYISGLIKALDLSLPVNQKVFIINQMQISGGSESVSALGSYIDDPHLYEPAIQALTTIGSKSAGEALLKALPTVNGKQKVAIIQALGMMRYEPAGEEILALLNDSNDIVRKLSGFALSNMGYDPANLLLGSMAEKDHQYVPNYLRFAERLGEKGDVESCRAICDEILNNENDYYSDNMRINALSILVKYNPDGARDRLFKMMSGHNKKMRMAALNLVDNYNISEVRMTALKALSEIQDVKSLPDMIFVMQDSLNELVLFLLQSENEKEQAAAIRAIASITNRSTSKKKQIVLIKDYYDKATLDEKMLLFNIFKAVGGDALMKITVQEMQSTDEQIREAAIRTLTEWPDTGALGILIDIGSNDQEERFRILALRGALRILRENPMGEQRALLYYKEIMNAAVRPEEKRQVLAGLAEIRTVSSLRLITSVLDDCVLSRFKVDEKDNLRARKIHTQLKVLKRIVIIVVAILALGTMLMTFEKVRQLGTTILASAGIIGIVVGMAAQRTIGTFIAGLQIAFTQPIRIDDVVIVENEWGRIEEITLTYVVVKIWDLRRLVVPITYFIEKPFQNWTRVTSDLLGTVYIYVDYTVPFEAIREELHHILKNSELWDGKVCVLQVTNTSDRTIELRALMSASDASTGWSLRCEVREKLIEFIQKNYPQSLPKLRAELKQLPKE